MLEVYNRHIQNVMAVVLRHILNGDTYGVQ